MAQAKRIVRHDQSQSTANLKARREADFLFGQARGQVVGFFDFIRSQGVTTLAVGIILGTAVTALVKSLVDDVLSPFIGIILPSKNLSSATVQVSTATVGWGSLVSNFLNFLLVAVSVYVIFKVLKLEKLEKKKDKKK